MVCNRCGAPSIEGMMYCNQCGSPLQAPPPVYYPPPKDDKKILLIILLIVVLVIVLPVILAGVLYIMVIGFVPPADVTPQYSARIEQLDDQTLEMEILTGSSEVSSGSMILFAQANNSFGAAMMFGLISREMALGGLNYTVTYHDRDSDGVVSSGDAYTLECERDLPLMTDFAIGLTYGGEAGGVVCQATYRT